MTQVTDIHRIGKVEVPDAGPRLRPVTAPPIAAPLEGSGLYAIDWRCAEDCERTGVLQLMTMLGAPRLRAIMHRGELYLLEGSHRAVAAQHLGLTIEIELLPCPEDCDMRIEDLFGNDRRHGDDIWGRVEGLLWARGPRVEVAWRVVLP